MDIRYINSFTNPHSRIKVNEQEYVVPRIVIACVGQEDDPNADIGVIDFAKGVKRVQENIMRIFNDVALDSAIELHVIHEGPTFHDSISEVHGVVWGAYGFRAIYENKSCRVAYMYDEKNIIFVAPENIVSDLKVA